ncbi:MAG: DUF5107 domain-containing protein, partial [Acidobacteriota bacterium]
STYPYTTRENLTQRRADRVWRTLNLENEHLKVIVLPDLGGRLYSCVDKSNGAELFYANTSIKFAQVAYRGAWVALGIEFNFPVSHNWMTTSPVDFDTVRNDDGSASIWVGNIDRAYGMMWRVALTLHPGSSLLEQTVTLQNRDFSRHRYYWWNTSSVESYDDSQIVYPMKYTASHGFRDIDTWPVDSSGVDLSIPGNHTRGFVSRFSVGSREPFMGVYHPKTAAGMVHYSAIDEAPGKKIWSWGWDQNGHTWRDALSDDHSSYLEIQAGLFRNQETYAFLEPQQLLRFHEYYMPVREIGGISRANLAGVLHLNRNEIAGRGSALTVGVNVNREVKGGELLIRRDDQLILSAPFELTPSKAFLETYTELDDKGPYRVEVLDSNGRLLIGHTEGQYNFLPDSEITLGPQHSYKTPPVGERGDGDFVEVGKNQELLGKLLHAFDTYREGLDHYPDSFELNKAAGRLANQLKRYEEAVSFLERARWRTDNDPEILYYLGRAYLHLGQEKKAQVAWESSALVSDFRIPAQLELARLWSRQGNHSHALALLQRIIGEAPLMLRAGCLEVAVLRTTGEIEQARARLRYWREIDPPNSFLRNEAVLLGADDPSLWNHLAGDPERVLELAVDYIGLGFYEDALLLLERIYPEQEVFSEPGTVLPQDYPLIAYYRAFCRERLGDSPRKDLQQASQLSTRYVFPNRPETLTVLKAAVRNVPEDATAHFLLGSLLLSGGRVEAALDEWEIARRIQPGISTLHRNIGYTQLIAQRSAEQALDTFVEGTAVDPSNIDLYLGADQAMSVLGRSPEDRIQVLSRFPSGLKAPSALILKSALTLAEANQYKKAEKLFHQGEFIREEFGTNPNLVYSEVQLQKALFESGQGRCTEAAEIIEGLGQPVAGLAFTAEGAGRFQSNPRVQYLLGQLRKRCKDYETAREHWIRASSPGGYGSLAFSYLSARELGKVDVEEWRGRLEKALSAAQEYSGFNTGLAIYAQGSLLKALGYHQEGQDRLREALLHPDKGMSHHLSREMLVTVFP